MMRHNSDAARVESETSVQIGRRKVNGPIEDMRVDGGCSGDMSASI